MSRPSRTSDRSLDERIAALRHDLRGPLGQIIGYSELLEEELDERGQADLAPDLQRIRDAARRLLERVDAALLPDASAPGSARAPAAPAAPQAATGSILVVDDEAANRDLLARVLERSGS